MEEPNVHCSVRIAMEADGPVLEVTFRSIDGAGTPDIPPGKALLMRTPIPHPGSDEEPETETVLIDDSGHDPLFCPDCAAGGGTGYEWAEMLARAKPGRNDRCPCGSGRKYKKCCLQ